MTQPLATFDVNPPEQPPSRSSLHSSRPDGGYPKQQVGVADYFAILGVGEDLIWKHAQKQKHQQQQQQQPPVTGESDHPTSCPWNTPEEDDAKLMERFYREIVDCAICVVDESTDPGGMLWPTTIVYTHSNSGKQRPYPGALPTSPSLSDVASSSHVGTEIENMELEGWTVVHQTRPLSPPTQHSASSSAGSGIPPLWTKGSVLDANLDPINGLSAHLIDLEAEQARKLEGRKKSSTPLRDWRQKVQSTFQQRLVSYSSRSTKKFYLSYRRRLPDESTRPAIADLALCYVRLHKSTIPVDHSEIITSRGDAQSEKTGHSTVASTMSQKGAAALLRVAEAGKQSIQNRLLRSSPSAVTSIASQTSLDYGDPVPLESLLELPSGHEEWSIPQPFRELRFPSHPPVSEPFQTILYSSKSHDMDSSGSGIEAVDRHRIAPNASPASISKWRDQLQPRLFQAHQKIEHLEDDDDEYLYVPILALRRQRIGEEERFHEDPALVDIAISFADEMSQPVLPYEEVDPFEDEDDDAGSMLLGRSSWSVATHTPPSRVGSPVHTDTKSLPWAFGTTCLLVRRNIPLGFCDAAFSTTVLDRFPHKNYKGLPLPEEELPMFCYPTGCRLHRAKFCDAPLPQYYGFVVKNERGDSIYVSCVSFMEPLTRRKKAQLGRLSEKRRSVSLPHAKFWAKRMRRMRKRQDWEEDSSLSAENAAMKLLGESTEDEESDDNDSDESNMLLTGFDEMTTFENKTICLVSRFPYWTAFRRFLSHLHSVSGSISDLPLERYISHLLLAVPIPKPGGPSVLIPLPTFNVPMMLWSPPSKDLPLLDLPYERLVSCLDVPTIVTIVLGFLALERKVIVMSTRPSLVLDVCELLRSLLFPFDLCAPYVPRLTEPFMQTLDFPGAIFVGIHDDGSSTGLAAVVRENMPEDSTIVDLDSGSIECSGDRLGVLNSSWGIIPPGPRSNLVSEIETLCRDAGIVPGQEPLDSLVDPAFDSTMPSTPVQDTGTLTKQQKEPLDDRGIRDAFLRFFCSVLGGYERYLVVPDVDFLISGNEWFDAKGFLAAASEEKAPFLGALVATQLFQSFIQRRTEASDVHCLLFDECLAEYHSSPVPYGRLGGDVETVQVSDHEAPQLLYSLLVDQSAAEVTSSAINEKSFDADSSRQESDTDSSCQPVKNSFISTDTGEIMLRYAEFTKNGTGDWVTMPSRTGLPAGARFFYCIDGNPTFPDRLNPNSYFPRQPESWLVEMTTAPTPMLTRSDKEIEEADRRRKLATTYRGLPTQRRCLWQLPKLMGSHFLGAWLLCIPALVAQPSLAHEQQSKYLLRALGALRLMRSKNRIVPDEAAYRALIVACGRTMSDRRMELVKLFGLLRSDGIFPSAVTLGQYTKALAEGYNKQRSTGLADDEATGFEVTESFSRDLRSGNPLKCFADPEVALASLDRNLANLEDSGRRWRQKSAADKLNTSQDDPTTMLEQGKENEKQRKKTSKLWLPVLTSWSLVPSRQQDSNSGKNKPLSPEQTCLVAMWSRTASCESCGYIPLEEEVQAGWDVLGGENDIPGAINCPRCGAMLIPLLGYRNMSIADALVIQSQESSPSFSYAPPSKCDGGETSADFASLPPQVRPTIEPRQEGAFVTYVSPATLRLNLERHIEENGEEILDRERLRETDPETFYNLWWYSARFSLPLPLPVASSKEDNKHYCAMVAWDYQIALRGCVSAAMVMSSLFEDDDFTTTLRAIIDDPIGAGAVPSGSAGDTSTNLDAYSDYPLLTRFNLQGYYATVWDHEDLSKVLVTLVEACDKRDFKPVVECLLRVNKRRRDSHCLQGTASMASSTSHANSGSEIESNLMTLAPTRSEGNDSTALWSIHNVELDCYRTALYLAKYQCTSAFHAFFPATLKPCKGYHFWCPIAPVPIFDRLLHEAVKRVRAKSNGYSPFHDVSDVALGFRSVFGHLL